VWQGFTVALGGRTAVPRGRVLPAEANVLRGLAILAIVWQGLWILPDPNLWPTRVGSLLSSILLAAVVVSWLAVVATTWGPWADPRRREIAQSVNLALVYAAAIDLFLELPVDAVDGWLQGASLVNLAVGLTGLLLRARTAVPIALTAVLIEAALLVTLDLDRLPTLTTTSEILYPLYALAVAAATIGGRRALVRAARRTRIAQEALARASADAEAMRRVELRLREQARLLHETVLNTLNAIARGGLQDAAPVTARIRERCADSAAVLASFAEVHPAPELSPRERWVAGVEPAIATLRESGVDVVLDLPGACDPPPEVSRAMLTAVTEALANVHRHAKAHQAWVRVHCTHEEIHVEIGDDGIGFDAAAVSPRFGLAQSIRAPLEEIAGSWSIDSTPGRGTRVHLSWMRSGSPRTDPFDTTAFVRPVLVSFGAFTVVSALLTLGGFVLPAAGIASLALAVIAGVVLAAGSRSGALHPAIVIGVCLSAPLIMRLQVIGLGTAAPDSWSDWSSEAIVGLLLVIAAAGPWWGWLAALATWVVTQGDVVGELLRPGTAVIIAGGLFARSVRASATASERASQMRAVELASALSDAESIRRTQQRYAALTESDAQRLMLGIASGSLDPRAPEVRRDCAEEERFIRSVMRLDPAANALHAFASRLAIAAHRRRIPLEIDLAEGPGPDPQAVEALESSVMPVLGAAASGEPARLTARVEGEALVVRLVMSIAESGLLSSAREGAIDGVEIHAGGDGSTAIWELRHG
jgi:signal transduction histidine kinase